MPNRSLLVAALALAVPAAAVVAQNRLLVPSQFAQIGAAVQAATPGTIIEVQSIGGPYQAFVLDRPVTIVGSAGEQLAPLVLAPNGGIGIDVQLAAGEAATISRIDVGAPGGAASTTGIRVAGGQLTLEDCRISGSNDPANTPGLAAVEVVDAEVLIAFCRFGGGRDGHGLRATRAVISTTKSRFFGGTAPAGHGVVVVDSTFHGADSWCLGGDAFNGGTGGIGIEVHGASRVTLVDGQAQGGLGTTGGSGIVNNTAVAVELLRSAAGGGLGFPSLVVAPATVGPTVTRPDLVGLFWSEPPYRRGTLQPGQPWGVGVTAAPNRLAVIALSIGPTGTAALWTRQPALLPQDIATAVAAVTDTTGVASYGSMIPNVVGLRGVGIWAQAVVGNSLPLEASPLSGVVVR
ncbi:MAG: hypothetical protein KDE27_32990 [Planctomycetes bacterium]|nr:hypothetical protein [Planctomycetota bacterium]